MVEYIFRIDIVFAALADPVRRDILARVDESELTVSQIALEYDMSLAAVSKHIKVLLEAGVIRKRRQGRFQMVSAKPEALREVVDYLSRFEVPIAADSTRRILDDRENY